MKNKVLLAEDHLGVQAMVRSFLVSEHGLDVSTADDGREALSLIEGGEYDLLLTDFEMPNMGGAELIKAIREQYPNMKTVLMSSIPFDDEELKLVGADKFIHKPFDIFELGKTIVGLLNQES
jgi:CheY-like chemotaxis protein